MKKKESYLPGVRTSNQTRFVKAGTLVLILHEGTHKGPYGTRGSAKTPKIGALIDEGRIGPEAGWDVYDVLLSSGKETWAYGFNLRLIPRT